MNPKTKKTPKTFRLTTVKNLQLQNVTAKKVTYRGKPALSVLEKEGELDNDGHALVVLTNTEFKDGVIEATLAGLPAKGADAGARGFIGVAFRVAPNGTQFECFYLRPTNGRADDQLRRNHATQYISHPAFPWYKLRDENPGVYESYTDLVTGAWAKIKIVVSGLRAELYVNGAKQPCLIVNDLKLGETGGQVALWIGGGTDAYFAEVTLS